MLTDFYLFLTHLFAKLRMVFCVRCTLVDGAGGSPDVRHESRRMSHVWGVGLTGADGSSGPARNAHVEAK